MLNSGTFLVENFVRCPTVFMRLISKEVEFSRASFDLHEPFRSTFYPPGSKIQNSRNSTYIYLITMGRLSMRPSIIEMADIPLDAALLKLVELQFYLFSILSHQISPFKLNKNSLIEDSKRVLTTFFVWIFDIKVWQNAKWTKARSTIFTGLRSSHCNIRSKSKYRRKQALGFGKCPNLKSIIPYWRILGAWAKVRITGKLIQIQIDFWKTHPDHFSKVFMDEFSSKTVWLLSWITEITQMIQDEFSSICQ